MIGNVVKIAIGAGIGVAAIAKRNTIKNVAGKVKDAVVDFFSGPDYSSRRAPHIPINGLDTVEDYVKLESDTDFVVNLSKRIEHDLRYILYYDDNERPSLGNLMREASEYNVFGDNEDLYHSLNNFRMARNNIVHGEGSQVRLKFRLEWTLAAFKLEESREESADNDGVSNAE